MRISCGCGRSSAGSEARVFPAGEARERGKGQEAFLRYCVRASSGILASALSGRPGKRRPFARAHVDGSAAGGEAWRRKYAFVRRAFCGMSGGLPRVMPFCAGGGARYVSTFFIIPIAFWKFTASRHGAFSEKGRFVCCLRRMPAQALAFACLLSPL